ncbi:MAG: GTPase Era [Bacteroidetes bacterium]|nr:GTPase Era [Bacteroidota bacterium]
MKNTNADMTSNYHTGYVALIGEPNVGKSTLLNALLEQKLSIVTPKPQTTRHKIAGILTGENYQIIFLDTPGLIKPKYALQEVMMSFAGEAIEEADVVMFLVDASGRGVAESVKKSTALARFTGLKDKKPIFVVLNKIDLLKKAEVLPLLQAFSAIFPFAEIIPVSALKGENLDDLRQTIVKYLPEGNALYPEGYVSDRDERFFVSELIREEIFKLFKEEVPYATTVEIEEFRESLPARSVSAEAGDAERKTLIRAVVYVERESHKGIIIGKGGAALKQVGQNARRQIEQLIGHDVFLELFVKVEREWRDDKGKIKRLGYR